jgi:hypothetical protein
MLEADSNKITVAGIEMDFCPDCFRANICLSSMTKSRTRKPKPDKPRVGRPKGSKSKAPEAPKEGAPAV